LCCLSFFDLRILTTPLLSSNSSFHMQDSPTLYQVGQISLHQIHFAKVEMRW
jgi:hypothetical protein